MYKKSLHYLKLTLAIISIIIISVSCRKKDKSQEEQLYFDRYLNEIFISEVQSDTLTMNYSLASPENYGITVEEISLGEYSITTMSESLASSENYLQRLKSFRYDLLTKEQQLTYDILLRYLENDLAMGEYLYYQECLGPTTGIQAQLPILLAEYNFYDMEDIDNYIDLLPCVYDYFENIALFEREKSRQGLFMSDMVADNIIAQCSAFIVDPHTNFLIEYFNEKLSGYEGLSDDEIRYYRKANRDGVLNYIIPAYELLIDTLQELKGTGTNNGGLYHYPKGREYYSCLARSETGSAKSMEEMSLLLEEGIDKYIAEISAISQRDPKLIDKFMAFNSFPLTDPNEILNDLRHDILKDFPEPVPVNCDIKYVHESLEEYLSPAMYLVPAIDNYKDNNIYINGDDADTLATIYTTVAHESYPGHLYQCVYFRNQNPAPIRSMMDFTGYDEGWATYVELYSYQLAGIDENLARVLAANNLIVLCMYARADIGIHYEGWSKPYTIDYILNYINNEKTAEAIYYTLLKEPVIYLPYAVGCLEIMELKDYAEDSLGNQFKLKDFHQFLLDIGPAPFDVTEDYLTVWIEDKNSLLTME